MAPCATAFGPVEGTPAGLRPDADGRDVELDLPATPRYGRGWEIAEDFELTGGRVLSVQGRRDRRALVTVQGGQVGRIRRELEADRSGQRQRSVEQLGLKPEPENHHRDLRPAVLEIE